MKIIDNVEIIDNLPATYFKEIDAIVIADLHLGYEGIAAEQGVFIPKTQFKEEFEMIKKILEKRRARRIIINGDIKHEFSATSYHEFREVRDMLTFLKDNFEEVIIVKGNHDNYIYSVAKKFGANVYEEFLIKDYFFAHGHKEVKIEKIKAKTVVIAHEHPIVALYDEVGGKEVVKSFLFGKMGKKNLIVLPAFSTLSYGTEINTALKEELLSPLLKKVNLGEFEAIGVDKEVGLLKFGKIKRLSLV